MMPQGQAELNSPIWSKGKWGEKREKGSCVTSQMKRPRPIAEARVFDISKLFKHSVAMYFPIEGRLEICRDRRDWRSFKILASCVKFSRKQRIFFAYFAEKYKIHLYIL